MSLGLTNIATINQAQTLSPQVQLTIKLLSLNNIELESYLEKKIEDNPLLIDRQNTKEHELRIQKYSDKYSRNSSNLDLLNNIGYAKSLREHLLDQLLISSMSNKEKIIATYLINILDEAGYLTENDETKIVIGYASIASNRVTIPVETTKYKDIEPISFNANMFASILNANKDCESATLEVSSQGLSRIKFSIDNYDSEYFLVSTQAVN